jgi:hypothetical protein
LRLSTARHPHIVAVSEEVSDPLALLPLCALYGGHEDDPIEAGPGT